MSTNVCAKFCSAALRIKKALGIFRELIITTTTTRVAFGTRLPGPTIRTMTDKGRKAVLNVLTTSAGNA